MSELYEILVESDDSSRPELDFEVEYAYQNGGEVPSTDTHIERAFMRAMFGESYE